MESSLEELHLHDLAPFRAAITEDVSSIMTAHVAFPALDGSNLPATLSYAILTKLLRQELLFDGLIITDSLIMEGIWTQGLSIEDSVTKLIQAGVDILLDPPKPIQFVEGIIKAVESGKLNEALLDASISRIQKLRRKITHRFGEHAFKKPFQAVPEASIGSDEHLDIAEQIAFNAIEQLQFPEDIELKHSERPALALHVLPFKTHLDPEEQPLGNRLRSSFPNLIYHEIDNNTTQEKLEEIRELHSKAGKVLLFVVSKPAAWRAFGLPDHLKIYLKEMSKPENTTTIAMGDPGILNDLPPSANSVCTYSDTVTSQHAIARWLKEI